MFNKAYGFQIFFLKQILHIKCYSSLFLEQTNGSHVVKAITITLVCKNNQNTEVLTAFF